MRKILAVILTVALLTATFACAEGMVDIASLDMNAITAENVILLPDAFQGKSDEFSLSNAWYLLSAFNQQDGKQQKALAESLGYTVIRQEFYDKPLTDYSHTSAYTLAKKEMNVRGEARTAAVIGIRATGDAEWYSNFDFAGENGSACLYAENFMAAAQTVFDHVKPDLDAMENPVIMVTGYSRGAATANLLGTLLNDAYGTEDIYVYTFATPNTVRFEKEGCSNIFNLVNDNDCITHMPLESWGFSRAGVDVVMKDETVKTSLSDMMFLTMRMLCPDIDAFYQDRHNLAAPGLSDTGMTALEFLQTLSEMLTNPQGMNLNAKKLMAMMTQSKNDFSAFFTVFAQLVMNGSEANGLLGQHMPHVYVGLMNGISK